MIGCSFEKKSATNFLIYYEEDIEAQDEGIECTLGKFADNSNLSDAGGAPEGWDSSRRTWTSSGNGPMGIS